MKFNSVEEQGTYLIGEYLVLSSWLERHINKCLEHFQFDKPVFDSIEKESFDFKCKRLRNYLHILEAYGHFDQEDLTYYYEHLGSLEVDFIPVRRLRNLLAHAVVTNGQITSSRRVRGENSAGMNMSLEQLEAECARIRINVVRSQEFFHQFDGFLSRVDKKKGRLADPFLSRQMDQ